MLNQSQESNLLTLTWESFSSVNLMCVRAQVTPLFTVCWSEEEEESPGAEEVKTTQLCPSVVLVELVCFVQAFYLAA